MNQLQMKLIFFKKKLDLTNEDIAQKSGLPTATISRICSGKTKEPKGETIRKIAIAMGLKVDDLLGTNDNVEPYYLDPETAKIAQQIKDNVDLKILLDSCNDLNAEQLKTFQNMVNMLKKQ